MHRYIALLFAFLCVAFVAGCGNGGTTKAVTTPPQKVFLEIGDVKDKVFYSVSPKATSVNDYVAYNFSEANRVTSSLPTLAGTWSISPAKTIIFIDSNLVQHELICIQKEDTDSYWLFYDASDRKISRFYFDEPSAQAYLAKIVIAPNHVRLGGSIQGTTLATFSNVTTVAGKTGTIGSTDGGNFNHPTGIATDGQFLYVTDTNNNNIRKMEIATGKVSLLAGSSSGTAGNANLIAGAATGAATFNRPTALTLVDDKLYVADTGNNTIRVVDLSNNAVDLFAGSTTSIADLVDSKGTDARFNQPTGITTDGTNLYVADFGNHTIRKIVISSKAVETLAGTGKSAGSSDSTDGTGATAKFNNPARITTDGSDLYVTDSNNRTIRKIVIATGEVTTLAGIAGTIGHADTNTVTGVKATFYQPNGITTDGTNLYVTDSFYNTIRKVEISNGAVTTILSTPALGSNNIPPGTGGAVNTADGPGLESFYTPIGITFDGTSLFVADSFNNLIRRIQ